MKQFTREEIMKVMLHKGYIVFDNNKPLNLNIVGIRSSDAAPNNFDDSICCFFRDNNLEWKFFQWKATTDPGLYWLLHPMNVEGTAILVEGQYRGAYKLGLHRGTYQALVQSKPLKVIRDFDRDNVLEFESNNIEEGFFGINIHRASSSHTSTQVDKWSAGCQVFSSPNDFNLFMSFVHQALHLYSNSFTYTLLNEKDFK